MAYSAYLPKQMHPFIYLSLEILSKNIDVNVSPTKSEVHFLYEETIIEKIVQNIDKCLRDSNTSRTFKNQGLVQFPTTSSSPLNSTKKVYDNNLVRTDPKEQKIDIFLEKPKSQEPKTMPTEPRDCVVDLEMENIEEEDNSGERVSQLQSVGNLRREIKTKSHKDTTEVIKSHTFVGCVNSEVSLIQYGTKLLLANTNRLSQELFYQIIVNDFANFDFMYLENPAPISELVEIALDSEDSGWTETDGSKETLSKQVVSILTEDNHRLLLKEYFSIDISQEGILMAIPLLLKNYQPCMDNIAMWVLRLATDVDWDEEEPCLRSLAKVIAAFYAFPIDASEDTQLVDFVPWRETVREVLYPALKKKLEAPLHFREDTTFIPLVDLSNIYKEFERC